MSGTAFRPLAWARRWYISGEKPHKVKGRWPQRFKFLAVTPIQCLPDDEPLFRHATEQVIQHIAAELPEGFEVELRVERGSGSVAVVDPDGERHDVHRDDSSVGEILLAALEEAKNRAGGAEPK